MNDREILLALAALWTREVDGSEDEVAASVLDALTLDDEAKIRVFVDKVLLAVKP